MTFTSAWFPVMSSSKCILCQKKTHPKEFSSEFAWGQSFVVTCAFVRVCVCPSAGQECVCGSECLTPPAVWQRGRPGGGVFLSRDCGSHSCCGHCPLRPSVGVWFRPHFFTGRRDSGTAPRNGHQEWVGEWRGKTLSVYIYWYSPLCSSPSHCRRAHPVRSLLQFEWVGRQRPAFEGHHRASSVFVLCPQWPCAHDAQWTWRYVLSGRRGWNSVTVDCFILIFQTLSSGPEI